MAENLEEKAMAACAKLTYNQVSPEAWQCIKQAVAKYDVTIGSDAGTASKDGLTISWSYESGTKILSVQCTAHPIFFPCSTINSRINDEIEACLNQHGAEIADMMMSG
jgi:hypothetical protein